MATILSPIPQNQPDGTLKYILATSNIRVRVYDMLLSHETCLGSGIGLNLIKIDFHPAVRQWFVTGWNVAGIGSPQY